MDSHWKWFCGIPYLGRVTLNVTKVINADLLGKTLEVRLYASRSAGDLMYRCCSKGSSTKTAPSSGKAPVTGLRSRPILVALNFHLLVKNRLRHFRCDNVSDNNYSYEYKERNRQPAKSKNPAKRREGQNRRHDNSQ